MILSYGKGDMHPRFEMITKSYHDDYEYCIQYLNGDEDGCSIEYINTYAITLIDLL